MFYKVRVWKGYFCYWLWKNWPTWQVQPHWTTTKYWTPLFLSPLTRILKKIPPINISHLKSWFPPLQIRGGGGLGGNYVLCSLTCLVYINNLSDSLESLVQLFGDETSLFSSLWLFHISQSSKQWLNRSVWMDL